MAARSKVTVIGAGNGATTESERAAEIIGRTIAEHGAIIVCGGKNGVMAAARKHPCFGRADE